MTIARVQACLKKIGFKFGYYNGKEIYLRTICKKDEGFCLYNNHLCLKWKSQGVSFS